MKTFNFNLELTLSQVIQLRALTGACNSFTDIYNACSIILKAYKVTPVTLSDYGRLDNSSFQADCDEEAEKFNRPTVTVGNRKYYEDELAAALANIKEVNW
jgi:hypothetical protein